MENQDRHSAYGLWLREIQGIGTAAVLRLFDSYQKNREGRKEKASPYDLAAGLEGSGFACALYQMGGRDLAGLTREAFGEKGGEKYLRLLLQARQRDPEKALEALQKKGISYVSLEDPAYPPRLRRIQDMPLGLYYVGRLPDPALPCAAVIGARIPDAYGREEARRFASALAGAGIGVVSGMARGVDGIAGRAALQAGGYSLAVLGCGVDVCYPQENEDLYAMLQGRGCIVSEYRPGTKARPSQFPPRNRIISGLSDLVLVVEAKGGSGTLITTDYALSQGKDVFALPGRITDRLSEGCNALLAQGAAMALSPRDLIEYFYGVREEEEKRGPGAPEGLSDLEKTVYLALSDDRPMDLFEIEESIVRMTGRKTGTGKLLEAVMMLILRDLAREEAVGTYCRKRDRRRD